MNNDLLKPIANSDYSKNLTLYLKEVQAYVADIRNGDYTNETRLATVKAIQDLLIDKLRSLNGEAVTNLDDYK